MEWESVYICFLFVHSFFRFSCAFECITRTVTVYLLFFDSLLRTFSLNYSSSRMASTRHIWYRCISDSCFTRWMRTMVVRQREREQICKSNSRALRNAPTMYAALAAWQWVERDNNRIFICLHERREEEYMLWFKAHVDRCWLMAAINDDGDGETPVFGIPNFISMWMAPQTSCDVFLFFLTVSISTASTQRRCCNRSASFLHSFLLRTSLARSK